MRLKLPRPRKHWTPRYAADRARLALWQRRHPDAPWLGEAVIAFLDQWLRPTDVLVEFGAGRSTLWFAARVGAVISTEHDAGWHREVVRRVEEAGHRHVRCFHAALDPATYTSAAEQALEGPADVILVDGRLRDVAALWALDHVRGGGLVVVDNAERYLPNPARVPESLGPDAAPASEGWAAFAERTAPRRRVWLDNGVTATLLVFA